MKHAFHVELILGLTHTHVSEVVQIGIRSDRRQRLPNQI
jgi:hypothetical protein